MAKWKATEPPRYEAPRPEPPSDPQLLDAPEFVERDDNLLLDLMRRTYVNLRYECGELKVLVEHASSTIAPFTRRDLARLDQANKIFDKALKKMHKTIKHERQWTETAKLKKVR